MNPLQLRRTFLLIASFSLLGTAFAGCLTNNATGQDATVREIRVWVEPMDWEIAPGVTTPVWAFCAEGDGVEPVHEGACGVPGPTIRVTKGDRIRLTLENTHSLPHSIHFHGWHPFGGDMNGNGILSDQMLAEPTQIQVIEWIAEPAGTFIYHCHFNTPEHMEMGMYGTFIVEDPAEKNKPDKEFVAVLDEWSIRDKPEFNGNIPAYNYFTINGKSFPLTQPWIVNPGDRVRIHLVDAGYEFHAAHLHGYTPDSWEGVAGPKHAVPTDVREIAPGQSVVLDFVAREGVWLFHDHVVPRVTAGSDGQSYGAYPRGMLTVLVAGSKYVEKLQEIAPKLVAAAMDDPKPGQTPAPAPAPDADGVVTVLMKNAAYADATVRVPAGTTVRWENRDSMVHTVTANDGSFDSKTISPGNAWSHTFDAPGTYEIHCKPHAFQDEHGKWQGMVTRVIVE